MFIYKPEAFSDDGTVKRNSRMEAAILARERLFNTFEEVARNAANNLPAPDRDIAHSEINERTAVFQRSIEEARRLAKA